jgi:hypothetical protein
MPEMEREYTLLGESSRVSSEFGVSSWGAIARLRGLSFCTRAVSAFGRNVEKQELQNEDGEFGAVDAIGCV